MNRIELFKSFLIESEQLLEEVGDNAEARELLESSIKNIQAILDNKDPVNEEAKEYIPTVELKNILKSGMIFKNYKALCELMGWKVATGNAKKSQFKQLDTLCKWNKEGNKIVIDEVYEVALAKVDNRIGNTNSGVKSQFKNDIEIILLDLLSKLDNYELLCSGPKLLRYLGIVNSNYSKMRYELDETERVFGERKELLNNWFNETQRRFIQQVETALKNIASAKLIKWSRVKVINITEPYVCENEYGFNEVRYATYDVEATREQEEVILRAEREVLEELGFRNIREVNFSPMRGLYWEKVDKLIIERLGINYYYTGYKIIALIDKVNEELSIVAEEDLNRAIENNNSKAVKKSLSYNKTIASKDDTSLADEKRKSLDKLTHKVISIQNLSN